MKTPVRPTPALSTAQHTQSVMNRDLSILSLIKDQPGRFAFFSDIGRYR